MAAPPRARVAQRQLPLAQPFALPEAFQSRRSRGVLDVPLQSVYNYVTRSELWTAYSCPVVRCSFVHVGTPPRHLALRTRRTTRCRPFRTTTSSKNSGIRTLNSNASFHYVRAHGAPPLASGLSALRPRLGPIPRASRSKRVVAKPIPRASRSKRVVAKPIQPVIIRESYTAT